MPHNILHVVQHAIDARRCSAAWFQKTGVYDKHGSTAHHLHVVRILERALSSLRPFVPAEASPLKPKDASSTPEARNQELTTRFGDLDVKDLDGYVNVAASDMVIADQKPAKGSGIGVYELEGQSGIDHAFVVFYFF